MKSCVEFKHESGQNIEANVGSHEGIVMLLEIKGFVCDFVTKIVNEEWKSDFMFFY